MINKASHLANNEDFDEQSRMKWTEAAKIPNDSGVSSVGAEFNIDSGLQLDLQARIRLGLAFPLANRQELRASAAQAYATFGASF